VVHNLEYSLRIIANSLAYFLYEYKNNFFNSLSLRIEICFKKPCSLRINENHTILLSLQFSWCNLSKFYAWHNFLPHLSQLSRFLSGARSYHSLDQETYLRSFPRKLAQKVYSVYSSVYNHGRLRWANSNTRS